MKEEVCNVNANVNLYSALVHSASKALSALSAAETHRRQQEVTNTGE